MTAKYFALLTNVGAAKLANATALGVPLKITTMAVGDGNGAEPTPDATQTALIHECHRAPLNALSVDAKNPSQIIAEQVLPETVGGWWVREIGLFDDNGDMIAVGNCPPSYKPLMDEGSGREQIIRMILIVSSSDAVVLKIDPSVVLATRQYVDDSIETHAKSRNHPDATLKAKGLVQLSSATNSDNELLAATPKAVKAVQDALTQANKAALKTVNDHAPDSKGNVTLTADDVSAFAIRKNLTAADSPNTLHGSAMFGHYGVLGDTKATVVKGYPIDGFIGAIFVMWGPNATQQVAFNNDGRQFTRPATGAWNGKDGPWGAWVENYNPKNPPTALEVGAFPFRGALGTIDLHTLTGSKYGVYWQDHDANSTIENNYPVTRAGVLVIYQNKANGAESCTMEYRPWNTNDLYRCHYRQDTNTWSGWAREFNSENPPTAANTGAVPTAGGDVGYLNNATHYGIKPNTWEGAGGFASQYTNPTAPFIIPTYTTPKDYSLYLPLIKGMVQTDGYGYAAAVSFGVLTSGNGDFPKAAIHVIGDNGTSNVWTFNPTDGVFSSPGNVYSGKDVLAAGGLYESSGGVRAYSDNNKPTPAHLNAIEQDTCSVAGFGAGNPQAPYMRNSANNEAVGLARSDWVSQSFLSGFRIGPRVTVWGYNSGSVPQGAIGITSETVNDDRVNQIVYAYPMYAINGNWVNAG